MSEQALRNRLIRLAHANPALRPHLLPLLATQKRAEDEGSVRDAVLLRWRQLAKEQKAKLRKSGEIITITGLSNKAIEKLVVKDLFTYWVVLRDGRKGWSFGKFFEETDKGKDTHRPFGLLHEDRIPLPGPDRELVLDSWIKGVSVHLSVPRDKTPAPAEVSVSREDSDTPRVKEKRDSDTPRVKKNPFVTEHWGSYSIGFVVPGHGWYDASLKDNDSEPLWWTGSGFKNLARVRAHPEDFPTQAEAERKIRDELLDFIKKYRVDQFQHVKGW